MVIPMHKTDDEKIAILEKLFDNAQRQRKENRRA